MSNSRSSKGLFRCGPFHANLRVALSSGRDERLRGIDGDYRIGPETLTDSAVSAPGP